MNWKEYATKQLSRTSTCLCLVSIWNLPHVRVEPYRHRYAFGR